MCGAGWLQFTAMVRAGQITDLRCFYDPEQRCVHAIVRLGRCVGARRRQ